MVYRSADRIHSALKGPCRGRAIEAALVSAFQASGGEILMENGVPGPLPRGGAPRSTHQALSHGGPSALSYHACCLTGCPVSVHSPRNFYL